MAPDINSLPPSSISPPQPTSQESQASTPDLPFPSAPTHSPSRPTILHNIAHHSSQNHTMHSPSPTTTHNTHGTSPRLRALNPSPRTERRRSSLMPDYTHEGFLGPPASPGAMSSPTDPQRQRAPSLGELHQELESEQEAQVNRLLGMIRQQQAQLAQLQAAQGHASNTTQGQGQAGAEDPTATHRSSISSTLSRQSSSRSCSRRQRSTSRTTSQLQTTSSRTASPLLHAQHPPHTYSPIDAAHPLHENPPYWPVGPGAGPQARSNERGRERERNDLAFYQAETQSVLRENAMLKVRIRELEREVAEARAEAGAGATEGESGSKAD